MKTAYITENFRDNDVTVVIPTFSRSVGLLNAIESVLEQTYDPQHVHLLIVDNNSSPQERKAVLNFSHRFETTIQYLHVPEAGLSNARNAAMSALKTRYVAFLDDDMIASPAWLAALIATSQRLNAGIVFGPTHAVLPDANIPDADFIREFFSRTMDLTGEAFISKTLGAGGCLLDLNLCALPTPVFDPALNQRGGEDDILFDMLKRHGTLVGWSPDAVCQEIVPLKRITANYIKSRSFGYGQGPSRICASRGFSGIFGVLYYMMAGAIQCVGYGGLYTLAKITRRTTSMHYVSRSAQGLGKVFWGDRFDLDIYRQKQNTSTDFPV